MGKNTSIDKVKKTYKEGSHILVHEIHDPFLTVDSDIIGIVKKVDDIGTIHVVLDNGTVLGLICGVDSFQLLK